MRVCVHVSDLPFDATSSLALVNFIRACVCVLVLTCTYILHVFMCAFVSDCLRVDVCVYLCV